RDALVGRPGAFPRRLGVAFDRRFDRLEQRGRRSRLLGDADGRNPMAPPLPARHGGRSAAQARAYPTERRPLRTAAAGARRAPARRRHPRKRADRFDSRSLARRRALRCVRRRGERSPRVVPRGREVVAGVEGPLGPYPLAASPPSTLITLPLIQYVHGW